MISLICKRVFCFVFAAAIMAGSSANSQVSNFTENFDAGDSNWRGAAPSGSDLLVVVPDGGPDGSQYVSTEFNFEFFPDGSGMNGGQPTPTLFRAQDEFGSSGGAFEGNWVADGVENLTFSIRHNIPAPTNFFVRFSSPDNFPGAAAIEFTPTFPGQWTDISIEIDPANPQIIFEGPASNFESVFSNIGHLQIGASVPVGFGGTTENFTFDLDRVSVTVASVPEPGATMVGFLFIVAASMSRRRACTPAT